MKTDNRKKKHGRRRIRNIVIIVAVVVAALIVLVVWARRRVTESFGTANEVLSAQVTEGSIRTTVTGSGVLAGNGGEEISLPDGITVNTIFVEDGDTVQEGDLLASVDLSSVLSALSDVQAELDELDRQISAASEDQADETIRAPLDGRVKAVYADTGDDVVSAMADNGALILLSLDGYMAVDVDPAGLTAGDSVTVTVSDGTVYDGVVDTVSDVAVVLLTDDGTTAGDAASVKDGTGNALGDGTLYVHKALKVTGYAGITDDVYVSENEEVSAGDVLLTLTDTAYSANYDTLLRQRENLENELLELIDLYQQGGIYASVSGVADLSENTGSTASYSMGFASAGSSSGETTLLTLIPEDTMIVSIAVDEADILSLAVGQEAEISVEAVGSERYSGTVTQIETSGSSSGGVTSYSVEVTLDRADGMLSGMTANVSITIEGVEDAMLLPAAAVTRTSSSAYVFTSWDETTGELGGMTEVVTGLSNSSYIEITQGLQEGDTVYYSAGQSSDSLFGMMSGGNIMDMIGNSDFSGSSFFDNIDSDFFDNIDSDFFSSFGGPDGNAGFGGGMFQGGPGGFGQ